MLCAGVLVYWFADVLDVGVLMCWYAVVLERWRAGQSWCAGVFVGRCARVLVSRMPGCLIS